MAQQTSRILVRTAQIGAGAFLASRALKPLSDRRALKSLRGGFAAVTGASSGIGFELARELAEAGCDVLIVSDTPKIEEAAERLKGTGARIEALQVDLSTFEGVERCHERIRTFGRPVDYVAINAGVGYGGDFVRDNDLQGALKLIELNVVSSVHLAKRVLEDMVERGQGKVLFTSSIAAFMAGSYEAIYSASKAFIESFAQGIRNELKGTGVTVTTLLPGATETEFFHRARMDDTLIGTSKKDDPARVARDGLVALARGKSHVIAGSPKNKLLAGMGKILPQPATAEVHRFLSKPGTARVKRAL